MADTTDQVVVRFLKSWKNYNQGERASFSPAIVKHLVDADVAKPDKKGSIFKRGKKPKTAGEKLDPGSRVRFFVPKEGDAIGTIVSAGKDTVTVAYDGKELEVARAELTFIAPPEPEAESPADPAKPPEPTDEPDVIEVGARVEFREGEQVGIGTVIEISGDAFSIETEEGAKHVAFREFVRLADEGGGGDGSQNARDDNPPSNA